MGERSAHWDGVSREKTADGMAWQEPRPEPSLSLLTRALPDPRYGFVDVGGGASLLVERLLGLGYRRPAVPDASAVALERARRRLAGSALVEHRTPWDSPRQFLFFPLRKPHEAPD